MFDLLEIVGRGIRALLGYPPPSKKSNDLAQDAIAGVIAVVVVVGVLVAILLALFR